MSICSSQGSCSSRWFTRLLAAMLGATVVLAMFWLLVEPVSWSPDRSLLKNSIYRQEFFFGRQGSLSWSNWQWRFFAARESLNLQELVWEMSSGKANQFAVRPNHEYNSITLTMRCRHENNNALAAFQEITDNYVRQYNTNAAASVLQPHDGTPLDNADGSEKVLRDWLSQQDRLYEKTLRQMEVQEKSASLESIYRRSILREKLDRIKERMALVRSFLPSKPAGQTETANAGDSETPGPGNNANRPLLQVSAIVTSCGLSRLGYLALALSIFVGIGLGLILCPTRRTHSDMAGMADIEEKHEQPESDSTVSLSDSDKGDSASRQQLDSHQQVSSWPPCYDRLAEMIEKLSAEKRAIVLISAVDMGHATLRAVVNLAIALSRRQQHVLLIEADAGSSDLAAVFDVAGGDMSEAEPDGPQISSGDSPEGFFQWRQGQRWVSQVVVKTSLAGVDFMPAGSPSQQQCEDGFDLSREQHRWGNLRGNYDAILLYCPAALSCGEDKTARQVVASQLLDLADTVVALSADGSNLSAQTEKIEKILQGHTAGLLDLVVIEL
jgi:Mrp family chromosome partitioning ATPase